MGNSGILDIVIRAQADEAQATFEKLENTIQQKVVQQGIAAFDTFSERIEQAFAQIEVAANQRAAGVQSAFSKLGVTSADSVKAQIQSLIAAYRQLKDAGESVSSSDLAAAHAAMVAKIQALSAAYRQGASAAKVMGDDGAAAAKEVETAWSRLGTMSTDTMAAKAKEIVAAFKAIKENAGDLGSDEVARARTGMLDSLEKLKKGYQQTGAAAKDGMSEAEKASLEAESALSRLGVQSAPQVKARIQSIIADYRTLKESGTLSARDLDAAHAAMVANIQKVSASYRQAGQGQKEHTESVTRGERALGSMRSSLSSLVSTYLSLYAAQRVFSSIITAYKEADKASYNLASSVQAANREFSRTGDLDNWKQRLAKLHDELKVFSEADLAAGASRTIDMTKRLGFDADQMETLIKRTAELSAGKVDLTEGIERVTSAMRGEAEASEYLGLTLNETYVKSWYEANAAHGKAWASLTDLEKAQVRFQVFLEQTASMQGKATESINTFSGALQFVEARLKDAVKNDDDLIEALKQLGIYFRDNSKQIGEFATLLINATAGVIKFVVENKELVLALAGVAVAAKGIFTLADGVLALVAAWRELKKLELGVIFASWAARGATVSKAVASIGSAATATGAALAGMGAGPLLALAAAATYAYTNMVKLVQARQKAIDLEEMASKVWKQATKLQKEADEAIRKYAASLGYTVKGEADFRKEVAAGNIDLSRRVQQTQGTSNAYKLLAARLSEIGEAGKSAMSALADQHDFAAKKAEKLAETEGGAAAQVIAAHRDKHAAIDKLVTETARAQLQAIDQAAVSEKEKADARREVYKALKDAKIANDEEWLKNLQSDIDAALAQEKRFAQEVRDAQKTTADTVRDINRQGMDDAAAYRDIMAEAREKLAQARAEEAKGTAEGYENAVRLAKEVESIARSSVSAGKDVVGIGTAVKDAGTLAKEAGAVWKQAAEEGKQAWADSVDALIKKYETLKQQIDDLKNKPLDLIVTANTDAVDKALDALNGKKTVSDHTVDPDTAAAQKAIADLEKPTSSTHTVYVKEVKEYAAGGPARSVPAMVMPGERIFDPDKAARYAPLLSAINSMTLAREAVGRFATGGGVFRPLRSGMVPGVGDEDSEPVLLQEGAFVVRKAAVAAYGPLLSAIEAGRVPAFASGGFVLPDWLRRIQAARAAQAAAPSAPAVATSATPAPPVAPTPLSVALAAPAAFRGMTTSLAAPAGMTPLGVSGVGRLDGLRQAGALRFASGGNLDETLADIALERQRTKENYDEAVADAKAAHDDDLADLLAQEQKDLDAIAQTLADTLAELQTAWEEAQVAYAAAMEEAQTDHDDTVADAQSDYAEGLADAKEEYDAKKAELDEALDEAKAAYLEWKNKAWDEGLGTSTSTQSEEDYQKQRQSDAKKSGITYTKAMGGFISEKEAQRFANGGHVRTGSYGGKSYRWKDYSDAAEEAWQEYQAEGKELLATYQAAQKAVGDLGGFTTPPDLIYALSDAKAAAETAFAESSAAAETTLADAQNTFVGGTDDAKTTAATDTAATQDQAASDKADLDQQLADTLDDLKKDFDRAMEDLDIEEARARADADEEKGYSISGFSQWLSQGGPVAALARIRKFAEGGWAALTAKMPHFADGGVAPFPPGAVAGQDSVPVVVRPGEGMIRPEAMAAIISERALAALNDLDLPGFLGALPHYADGGMVPGGAATVAAAARLEPAAASAGGGYTATLNLAVGGKSFETRATRSTADALARELRRAGVNVR